MSLFFTAADLEAATSHADVRQSELERESLLISDLLTNFKTRREQVAEWTRLTGRCGKTLVRRLKDAGLMRIRGESGG